MEIICKIILTMFFTVSTFCFLLFVTDTKKQKGMIIFTGIMLLISISLIVIFMYILEQQSTVGAIFKRIY